MADTLSILTRRREYDLLRSSMMATRSGFESHWQELANFIKPRRIRFFTADKDRGDKRNRNIIDSTATWCADVLRSGMHAGITSPARPWMKLTTHDPSLASFGPVKEWLAAVTKQMLDLFASSNLYQTIPTIYGDMGVFGTAAMAVMEDEEDLIRATSFPVGSYALGFDDRGICNTFMREFQMTVRQIVRKFAVIPGTKNIEWGNVSQTVKDAWDKGNYEVNIDVVWIITPNEIRDADALEAKYKKFASCWFEKGCREDKFLRESGFDEFPVLAPRWDVTGEDTYGTECPGMVALGDVKQLQTGEKRGLQALEKMVNPPVQAPPSMRNQKASLLPGEISYVAELTGQGGGIKPIHEINFAIEKLEAKQESVRGRLMKIFFTDLFLMMAYSDRREITAREVEERHEEKLLALGPVLERTNDELLDPLVDRIFAIMLRYGLVPPPPPELSNARLGVEYIGLLAQAQKLVGVASHERFLLGVTNLAAVFPEARHKVQVFNSIDEYGDMLGVAPRIIRSSEEATASYQQEQQALAAAQAAKNAQLATAAGKNLSQTPTGGDTALSQIIENARG